MKRRILRKCLCATGMLSVRWKSLPAGLYCFAYHRIGDASRCEFDRGVFSCTVGQFEEQVGELKRHFEIVSLERFLHDLDAGSGFDRRLALLTFDDGYLDNYTVVFPILRAQQVSAAFFLPTAFVGTGRVPWWDEIAWLLRHSARSSIRLPWSGEEVSLQPAELERSIRNALSSLKRTRALTMQAGLDLLRNLSGASILWKPASRLFMNWDEARQMRAAGMEFGSHGHSHEVLSHLSAASQREELGRSKEILEGALRQPIQSLAYPVGGRHSYNHQTCALARSTGYRIALTLLPGRNPIPLRNPFELTRISGENCADLTHLKLRIAFPGIRW